MAVLADCEVAGGEVREDNQWLMMSMMGDINEIQHCLYYMRVAGNQHIGFVISSALSTMDQCNGLIPLRPNRRER